ncbi:MAG: glycosyl transferase family 25 [Mariniflexile sp.]|jgi:glycosyl transferase family 25
MNNMSAAVKCFYINLDFETKKRDHMNALCVGLGHDFTRINAVVGKTISDSTLDIIYNNELARQKVGRNLTKGEIGCALSHIAALKLMVENNNQYAVIYEDDIKTDFNSKDIQKIIENIENGWDIVLLGHHPKYTRNKGAAISFWNRQEISKKISVGRFVERPLGAYAYLISQDAAKNIINDFNTISIPFDWWNIKEYRVLGLVRPNAVIADDFSNTSTLSVERLDVNYNRNTFQKIKDLIRFSLIKLNLFNLYFLISRLYKQILKR